LIFAQLSNLHKTSTDSDAESSSSSEEDDEKEDPKQPKFIKAHLRHKGGINRVRSKSKFVAVTGEKKTVSIYDSTKAIQACSDVTAKRAWMLAEKQGKALKPVQCFTGHRTEGYGLDWADDFSLLTGDSSGLIHHWKPNESGWHIDQVPYSAYGTNNIKFDHSIEEIQWQPKSSDTFVTGSVYRCLRIWDIRSGTHAPIISVQQAHDKDINVMSWSSVDTNFIVTGGDDCALKIWDCRNIQSTNGAAQPLAVVKHHTKPITSVEWHPKEDGVFAASGEDDQVTIWDFGVEESQEHQIEGNNGEKIPQQLLFIHAGHKEYKEVRWDSEKPGNLMTTSGSGFSMFRTISV